MYSGAQFALRAVVGLAAAVTVLAAVAASAPVGAPAPSGCSTGSPRIYGPGFHGEETASGEIFNQGKMVAAHRTLPLGTVVRVTNLENRPDRRASRDRSRALRAQLPHAARSSTSQRARRGGCGSSGTASSGAGRGAQVSRGARRIAQADVRSPGLQSACMADARSPVFRRPDRARHPLRPLRSSSGVHGDDAAAHWADIPATPVKNLFLRNKKGDRHYLVILGDREAGGPAAAGDS